MYRGRIIRFSSIAGSPGLARAADLTTKAATSAGHFSSGSDSVVSDRGGPFAHLPRRGNPRRP